MMEQATIVALIVGGSVAVLGALLHPYLIFTLYGDTPIQEIVGGLRSSSLYFGTSMATATATLLGLMLTLLSLATNAEKKFDQTLYSRVKFISVLAVTGFILSLLQLATLSFPLGEFSAVPKDWFNYLYYIINSLNFLIIGVVITLTLLLTSAIWRAIREVSPAS